jgi:hypothetical protein
MVRLVRFRLIYFATLACAVCSGAWGAGPEKLFRWKLHPGQQIHVRLAQTMKSAASIQGTALESSVDMRMSMKWHVLQVDQQGTAEMTQSIEHMSMTVRSPGSDVVQYDSSSPAQAGGVAQGIADGIQPLLGVNFIQRMNARGEILDVRLSPEAEQVLENMPAGAQLKEMFSENGIKTLVNQAAAVLPEHPVRPGDQWRGQAETKSPAGSLRMDIFYRYEDTEQRQGRELERIAVSIKVSLPPADNPLGLEVNIVEQDNQGVLYFDARGGRFVETQLRQRMTLETVLGSRSHRQDIDTRLRMQFLPGETLEQAAVANRNTGQVRSRQQ